MMNHHTDTPLPWGLALQERIEDAARVGQRQEETLDAIQDLRADVNEQLCALGRQLGETLEQARRQDREVIALELAGIYDTCREATLEVMRRGNPRDHDPEGKAARALMHVAVQAREALSSIGVYVRDDGVDFEPSVDQAVGSRTVDVPAKHRAVLQVEAAGFRWVDGGVLRPRHVIVGLYTNHNNGEDR